jgi:hypothetical protein
VSRSELAVLLLGASYDQSETPRRLAEEVRKFDKPFVIWPSPAVENAGDLAQRGLLKELRNLECARKTLLSPIITPEKLTDEAKAILHNKIPPAEDGKPRVYLVYDSQQNSEAENAGQIALNYAHEFYFEHSDNPRLHTGYLTQSDGVLLVWGDAAEEWCSTEFDLMVRLSNQPKARGLCLFDPKQPKLALAKQIRSEHPNICVAEQFGKFDKAGLDPFFAPLRRSQGATA